MPSVFVDVPRFPTVPPLPGVPPLNLDPTAVFTPFSNLTADAANLSSFNSQGKWGLYAQSGQPALIADSVQGVEYARDYAISDYPQTEGAFESYNKVQRPFQAKLTYLVGTDRAGFLAQVEAVAKALDLYTVITPEISYANANVTHVGYRRIATNGVTLIQVEVWVEEVRVVNTGALSSSQSPNGSPTNNDGTVQPVEAQTRSATAADGSVTSTFVTPPNLAVGLGGPPTLANTQLGTTIGQEFGTTIVTEPLGIGIPNVQAGVTIPEPDVAMADVQLQGLQ